MYKKSISTIRYIVILVLLILLLFILLALSNKKETVLTIKDNDVTLTYNYDGKTHMIKGQKILADDAIHIFAPSFYNLENITIDSDNDNYLIKEGYYYQDNFTDKIVNKNQISKAIRVSNSNIDIIIHKLENQTLSIKLKNDYKLEDIHNNKELMVASDIISIDKYGKTLFNGELKYIKGRGNSTWLGTKKGYSLVFSKAESICGIEQTKKYVLIPSQTDMTGMRNKVILSLAEEIGLEHTPKSEFTNVFINGEYEGLYLLSQHVSVDNVDSSNKNNKQLITKKDGIGELKEIKYFDNKIASKTNKYLLERELFEKYQYIVENVCFTTNRGGHYLVHKSQNTTKEEMIELALKVQQLENYLYSENDEEYLKLVDLDSWAKQFLIELISQNYDAYRTSSYFYYDVKNNLFFGGPVWDYDMSLGYGSVSVQNPKDISLMNKIYSTKKQFIEKVGKLFKDLIYPNKDRLIYGITDNISKQIKNDMYLNAIRYNQQNFIESVFMFEKYDYDNAVSYLQGHLYERIDYLNKILNSDTDYCKVLFITRNNNCGNSTFLVEKGKSFTEEHEIPYYSSGNGFVWYKPLKIVRWLDKDGKEFDFTKPITKDVELYAVWEGDVDAYFMQK